MFFWFRRTWADAVHAFYEGIAEVSDEAYDEQEWARQRLLRHVSDLDWTDEEVSAQFLSYAKVYDPSIRLTRTKKVLEEILRVRGRNGGYVF